MKYQAVLFDLDGTLLPMDQEVFIKSYFGLLAKKVAPLGYEPKKLVDSIWKGTYAMMKNDGSCTNSDRFWQVFASIYGEERLKDVPVFESFYKNEFQQAKEVCGFQPLSKEIVELCKEQTRVVLATSPIFPNIATFSRIRWAGCDPRDFEWITTYENCRTCKPNPQYYQDLVERLDLDPSKCLMVGNDVSEDMIANTLGMDTYLVTDCLINSKNEDIDHYAHGSMKDLKGYLASCL